jgi:hypothetical protein
MAAEKLKQKNCIGSFAKKIILGGSWKMHRIYMRGRLMVRHIYGAGNAALIMFQLVSQVSFLQR